jgi:RNA polymerase sigma-70 factor (ECF subfamily)
MSRNVTTIAGHSENRFEEPAAPTVERRDATRLFDDHFDRVYSYVARRVASRDLAEDVTADTFRAAIESIGKLKRQDPYLWLLGIARRKVADAFRDERKRRSVRLGSELDAVACPDHERPDEVALTVERAAELRKLVLRLPEDQREALLLQHLELLSQDSIAHVMRKSPAAVNSLQQRARSNILKWGAGYFTESDLGGNI